MSYVELVKDVFLEFVDFMKKDWRAGLAFAFDTFLSLLKATFKSAVTLAIAGGKGIWRGVKLGLLGGKEKDIARVMKRIYESPEMQAELEERYGPLHRVTHPLKRTPMTPGRR